MNPSVSGPTTEPTEPSVRSTVPVPAPGNHPLWSREVILWTVALIGAQAFFFFGFARSPQLYPVPANPATITPPLHLALDGIPDGWLPDPRSFLGLRPTGLSATGTRTARPQLFAPEPRSAARSLSVQLAPALPWPVVPAPSARPVAVEPPRPASPATKPLALTEPQTLLSPNLRERTLTRPLEVAPWTGPEPLGVTRVDVAVNGDGEVILARVVDGCGVPAADARVLAAIWAARFSAGARPRPGQEFAVETLLRGRISWRWPGYPTASNPPSTSLP